MENEFNALVMLFYDLFVVMLMLTFRHICQSALIEHMDLDIELLL